MNTTEQQAPEPQLEPCSCGRSAKIEEFFIDSDPQPWYVATCEVCPIQTYDQTTVAEAARIWNTFRAPVAAPPAPSEGGAVAAAKEIALTVSESQLHYAAHRARNPNDQYLTGSGIGDNALAKIAAIIRKHFAPPSAGLEEQK
jgi:hypothetical protein